VKFAFIDAEKAFFPIAFMCRMLKVSRSGYYASRTRPTSSRVHADRILVPLMHAEFRQYPRGCGARTLMGALRAHGHCVSRRRVVRLMKQEQLRHRLKRRFVRTTNSRHSERIAPNVLMRRFEPGRPNRAWVGDITFLPTKTGWAYLAALLDVGSRKVVGWSVGPTMDQGLVLRALHVALVEHRPLRGLIHHSDQGVQYASREYRAVLEARGIVPSMSRKGNCWDNAVAESFFSTLKRELPNEQLPADWREAQQLVFEYVAAHYNTNRRHSALGYLTPTEYEFRNAA
jgi:transposase InsO family protein